MNELLYKIWFFNLKITDRDKLDLLKLGLKPHEIYNLTLIEMTNMGINLNVATQIIESKKEKLIKDTALYLTENDINLVLYDEIGYPERLKNIYDPPIGLFIKGEINEKLPSIAIVGSRKASDYGLTVAYKFSYELSKAGIVIISGLAKGIDAASHYGAVDADGLTIAVMGSGFKNIYPRENINLLSKIIKKGAVVSEFLPDEKPLAHNFPRRNRIISGLSDYVLVVEAGERSGSLITANIALEQGKDVFAVPGNIFSVNSIGTNNLIKDGAKLVSTIEDILEEYGIVLHNNALAGYNELELSILNKLKIGGMTVENIVESLSFASDEVLAAISKLECMGILKRTFGNFIILNNI
ncbi:hypothetical protein ABG79_01159 [Caloramator mitchellensis]|uniref:Smf/DprA SLOG domain-containing protein n=1 Tax=Caloramator mitchellensis TaxID=908809 RepID=A0A0R3JTV9_CALMK|nr:DNA-processing protein DprA [Caloramator mitchellensis]KRQ86969.1 hypothetical protein ABG79_01159 [Caloramator mitchellensis]